MRRRKRCNVAGRIPRVKSRTRVAGDESECCREDLVLNQAAIPLGVGKLRLSLVMEWRGGGVSWGRLGTWPGDGPRWEGTGQDGSLVDLIFMFYDYVTTVAG